MVNRFLFVVDVSLASFYITRWRSPGTQTVLFALRCRSSFHGVLVVCGPFQFDVMASVWNLIVSFPDYCIFLSFGIGLVQV